MQSSRGSIGASTYVGRLSESLASVSDGLQLDLRADARALDEQILGAVALLERDRAAVLLDLMLHVIAQLRKLGLREERLDMLVHLLSLLDSQHTRARGRVYDGSAFERAPTSSLQQHHAPRRARALACDL